jgi:hypothetical protein
VDRDARRHPARPPRLVAHGLLELRREPGRVLDGAERRATPVAVARLHPGPGERGAELPEQFRVAAAHARIGRVSEPVAPRRRIAQLGDENDLRA